MATKQSDGRYRAKVTVGHDADGKSIVKYVSGRTKKELEAARRRPRGRMSATPSWSIGKSSLGRLHHSGLIYTSGLI